MKTNSNVQEIINAVKNLNENVHPNDIVAAATSIALDDAIESLKELTDGEYDLCLGTDEDFVVSVYDPCDGAETYTDVKVNSIELVKDEDGEDILLHCTNCLEGFEKDYLLSECMVENIREMKIRLDADYDYYYDKCSSALNSAEEQEFISEGCSLDEITDNLYEILEFAFDEDEEYDEAVVLKVIEDIRS